MSRKQLFIVAAMSIMAGTFCEVSVAQINPADPDAAQKQFSQPSLPQDSSSAVQQQGGTQGITQKSSSDGSSTAAGESSPVKAQKKNGQSLLIVFPLLVLAGLCFVMFIGRRRRVVEGVMSAPAPGSKESPIIGKPIKEKSKRK